MAGVVLMVPVVVETGDAAVVEDVEGFLESSFSRCSLLIGEACSLNTVCSILNIKKPLEGCTLSAFNRACSSSSAACFSLSSTLVKEIPVLAREDTALDRVLALFGREIIRGSDIINMPL